MRFVHRSGVGFALAVTASAAGLFAHAQPDAKPDPKQAQADAEEKHKAELEAEKAARAKIVEFNKALGTAKGSAEIANAIRILDVKHQIILEKLVAMLGGPGDDAIHMAVIDALVKLNEPRCVPVLNSTLLTKLSKWRDNAPICVALLKAMGHYGDRRAAPSVARALDCNDNAIATEACSVAGKIKDPAVIDELIKLLREAEQPDAPAGLVGGGGNWGGGGGTLENRRKALREPAQSALKEATGKSFGSARDWQSWWAGARNTWKP
jgi:HEAT repeat protein